MDLPADLAELALDRRVHVLVRRIDRLDRFELRGHLRELAVVEDARGVEPLRVQQRRLQVVGQELRVVGAQEVPHLARELSADASRPERHSGTSPMPLEHRARVGDVVDLHRELPDPVGRAERGRAPLHAQPLRLVRDDSPRVSRIV